MATNFLVVLMPRNWVKKIYSNINTQLETLKTSCKYFLAWYKFVHKLQQVRENQTRCNKIFADLLQIVETTPMEIVDKKSWHSTCSKTSIALLMLILWILLPKVTSTVSCTHWLLVRHRPKPPSESKLNSLKHTIYPW